MLLLLACAIILFIIWIWNTFIRRQLPGVPTPKAAPIIGHLLQLGQDPTRPFVQMYKWAQECGPVYSVRIFSKEVLFINSYEALTEAMIEKGKEFSGRPNTLRACVLLGDCKKEVFDIAMRPSDEYWARMRNVAMRSLKYHGTENNHLEAIVIRYSEELLDRIKAHGSEVFDARQDVYEIFTAMMYTLVFGLEIQDGSEEMEACKEVERVLNQGLSPDGASALLDEMPWLKHFQYPAYKTVMKAKKLRDNLFESFTKRLNEVDNTGNDRGLYDSFYNAQLQFAHEDDLKNKINCVLTNVIIAGLCTTANTMSTLLLLLVIHQDIQAKMREEIDEVLGNRRMAELSDKHSLHYTRAVIMEVLRIFCVAPITLPHTTITNTSVGDYKIPKGTTVMLNIWAALHSEKDWQDPMRFDPSRFLDEHGKLLPKEHKNRQRLIPFGGGLRQCLGEKLANTRLLMFSTAILRHFTLHPDPENPPDFHPLKCEMNTIILAPSCKMIAKSRV